MITQDNIPVDAIKVSYQPFNGERFDYFVWENRDKKGGWYWSALGNGNLERTLDGAREAARIWIRDGVSAIGRFG